jgi:hypothetical protein
VTDSLSEVEELLRRTQRADETSPLEDLRQWRSELVHASVYVSYALSVLSLDNEILHQALLTPGETDLQSLVDNLPRLLASGWTGGGWSLSPDAVESVVAADDLTRDYAAGLLGLHAKIVSSDLRDPQVIDELLEQVEPEKLTLSQYRDELERRIRDIQAVVLHHYTTGAASVDDWLK